MRAITEETYFKFRVGYPLWESGIKLDIFRTWSRSANLCTATFGNKTETLVSSGVYSRREHDFHSSVPLLFRSNYVAVRRHQLSKYSIRYNGTMRGGLN